MVHLSIRTLGTQVRLGLGKKVSRFWNEKKLVKIDLCMQNLLFFIMVKQTQSLRKKEVMKLQVRDTEAASNEE